MYYNNSKINISDCLVIYVNDYITEMAEVLSINKLKIINSKIAIENNNEIMISAVYRKISGTFVFSNSLFFNYFAAVAC